MLPRMPAPHVRLDTDQGTIELELDPERAPKSVENFLQYVDAGHYDGTVFHRVIPGFMAQGGGFTASYDKKAVREGVENEAHNGVKNLRGTVAMARTSEPHSATSQFFVSVKDNAFLDHTGKTPAGWGYTVFAKVVSGMDVVDKIVGVPTGARGPFAKDAPLEPVVIKSVRRA
jgi:cyclophilin family peptidyl-prolyl cis-trans isomerase